MNAQVIMSSDLSPKPTNLQLLSERLAIFEPRVIGDSALEVTHVFQDSRKVVPGALFVARSGLRQSGLDFWHGARQHGAVGLMREPGNAELASTPGLVVNDVRRALGVAAETVYGDPTRALGLVGITGTNGKTTTAWLTQIALEAAQARAGRLGTLGFAFGSIDESGALTTPEADDISRYAARVVAGGGSHLVMEVSSHALSQARVDALSFRVAAFSNLSQDHLDFHGDMQAYGAAKRRLFEWLAPESRVVNIDDAFGRSMVDAGSWITVSSHGAADVSASNVSMTGQGMRAQLNVRGRRFAFQSRLVGWHNLDNVLLSLGIVLALELPIEPALQAFVRTNGVPGRFERCDAQDDDIAVLVDYAHTPEALERVLLAAAELPHQRLVCVFGCGGDRDSTKRAKMGTVVGQLATFGFVTNDNPRSEAPELIAEAICTGLDAVKGRYEVVLDRAQAIEQAIVSAQAGDVVVIAGKGHEPYQLIGNQVLAFDDRAEARRSLAVRRGHSG